METQKINELVRLERHKQRKILFDIRKATGIDEARLSRYENGQIELPIEDLARIFKALKMDIKLLEGGLTP